MCTQKCDRFLDAIFDPLNDAFSVICESLSSHPTLPLAQELLKNIHTAGAIVRQLLIDKRFSVYEIF